MVTKIAHTLCMLLDAWTISQQCTGFHLQRLYYITVVYWLPLTTPVLYHISVLTSPYNAYTISQ